MATARTFIHAAPEDIFNVLSNPDASEYWVVGCQEIREMRQQPAAGPIAKLDNPLQQFFTSIRDRACLRRLRRLAEQDA